MSEGLYRTTDGGYTWRLATFGSDILDITFKDSLIGWCCYDDGALKTTDGGVTWQTCFYNPNSWPYAIYYDSISKGLFLSPADNGFHTVSWDEGVTWSFDGNRYSAPYTGFAFANGDNGILVGPHAQYRTTDGGQTWSLSYLPAFPLQPLAIPNTKTYFINSDSAVIMRTDDYGVTWKPIYRFPEKPRTYHSDYDRWTSSGSIRGTYDSLYAVLMSGAYLSTDHGKSWRSLCGIPSAMYPSHRFYVKSNIIYILPADSGSIGNVSDYSLWRLNLDSMEYFSSSVSVIIDDSLKIKEVNATDTVIVSLRANTEAMIGVDSVHLTLHFEDSLTLQNIVLPAAWHILDSSTTNHMLDLWIISDAQSIAGDLLRLTFGTVLKDTSAKVYLDSMHFYGKRLNCNCGALSVAGSDSVAIVNIPPPPPPPPTDSIEVGEVACDSLIVRFMRTGSLVRIDRIVPNPARDVVRVEGIGLRGEVLEVYDVMGREIRVPWSGVRGPGETTPQPPPISLRSQEGEISLDVRGLAEGMYYLRIGTATARFEILR